MLQVRPPGDVPGQARTRPQTEATTEVAVEAAGLPLPHPTPTTGAAHQEEEAGGQVRPGPRLLGGRGGAGAPKKPQL